MLKIIMGILIVLVLTGISAQSSLLKNAKKDLVAAQNELSETRNKLAETEAKYGAALLGNEAVTAQAQACLNREAAAVAETEEWKELFRQMTTREMTEAEKREVPDEKTRNALFIALDAPL